MISCAVVVQSSLSVHLFEQDNKEESLLWEAHPLTRQYPWHQERASWCCQHPDRWPAVRILIAHDSSLIICVQSNGTVLKQNIFWWEKENDITKKKKKESMKWRAPLADEEVSVGVGILLRGQASAASPWCTSAADAHTGNLLVGARLSVPALWAGEGHDGKKRNTEIKSSKLNHS